MGCLLGRSTKVGPLSNSFDASAHTATVTGSHLQESHSTNKPSPIFITFPNSTPKESNASCTAVSSWTPPPSTRNSEKNKTINILLLGESGVGKSTFINALVNYHKFDTFEQASQGEPIVVMPVSFLLTTGDNFEEKIVRFGGKDINEDFDHPGQSVTQQCKSYIFTVGTRTRLRLIDTPGMGDTRGLEQDDRNMQHILSFVNNLSHLNAICILLKPNESKLSVVFRSYFGRLTGFLGENSRNNIIFCFTNTRTTFFTPGDTAPLLKEELKKNRVKDIPFTKQNTFCFDSESFRYLVSIKNGIKFPQSQEAEYNTSWRHSATETTRLLTHVRSKLEANVRTDWKSIEYAQFRINQMVRPMLETTRNIMRNVILAEKSVTAFVELQTKPVARSFSICINCDRALTQCGLFWIYSDKLHQSNSKRNCNCNRENVIDMYYELHYNSLNNPDNLLNDTIEKDLSKLREGLLQFRIFFSDTSLALKSGDPILQVLNQMIEEENKIVHETNGEATFNMELHEKLKEFKEEYENRSSKSKTSRKSIDLENIFKEIENINTIHWIKNQMDRIEQYNQSYMQQQEKALLEIDLEKT